MRHQRTVASTLLALLVTGMAVLGMATAASAHSQQIGSNPAADEIVTIAPSEVVIEFDSPLVDMGAAVAVRSQDEVSITTGPPVIGDRRVTVPVDPTAVAGTYTVAYRVVSEDGHTITSTFQYTVEGDAGSAAPAASATATTATPSTSSTPLAADPAATQASADSSNDSSTDSGISPILIAVVVALVLIVAVIAAIALRR